MRLGRFVAAISCTLLVGVAVACSASATSSSSSAIALQQGTPTATFEPSNGGRTLVAPVKPPRPAVSDDQRLVMAGSADGPQTLDPALVRDAESSFYTRQLFRGLVRLDDDLQPQPDLCERIEISADGLTYTCYLRSNAVFHDGSPIDANGVVASLIRAADPALMDGDGFALPAAIYLIDIAGTEERLAGEADTISGLVAVDERTVRITLREPTANFLYKLTGNAAQIVDVAAVDGADWWSEPNGSGPFRLERWDDDEIVLTGFDEFYDGAPLLNEVQVLLGGSAFQPLNLYESGQIDLTEVPFFAVDRVLSPDEPLHVDLTVVPQLSTSFILLNPNLEPFDEPAVRRVVVTAFDRSKVAAVMFDGKVTQADGIVPPGVLDRKWPATNPPFDLSAARTALESVGTLEFQPEFYGSGAAVSLAAVLERDLGIEAAAIGLEWLEFTDRLTARSLPSFALTWIADFPDPANFLASLFLSDSPDNYIGYSNPEVDRLLRAAEREMDVEERARLYLDAQQHIIDDAVLIPLYHDVSYTVVKPEVNGLMIAPIGILSLEDVWIDD